VFYTPVDIPLVAYARDVDGSVSSVEFFADSMSLGIVSNGVVIDPLPSDVPPPGTRAYLLTWSTAPIGTHVLTAVATDNGGLTTTSAPVNIAVRQGPPPTNLPPVVQILSPTNGQTFLGRIVCPPCLTNKPPCELPCYFEGPAITLCADASDPDDWVAVVEFFANGHRLGTRTNCFSCANPINPFCLVWTNVPPGDYVLTAIAIDTRGATGQSAPVNITVQEGPAATNLPPVVTVVATDAYASLPCSNATTVVDTGTFTVTRYGPTNDSLTVYYTLGGTALNGVDYVTLPGSVTIAPGALTSNVVVTPLAGAAVSATKTVVLQLIQPVCIASYPPPPGCYQVGLPYAATVYIQGCPATNFPPVVRITSPADRTVFYAPVDIPLFAYAVDYDGSVASVRFFDNDQSLGLGQPLPVASPASGASTSPIAGNLYSLVWSNAPVGLHALTAIATDNGGASTTSAPVNIAVSPSPPPPTNRPPIVDIIATDPIAIEGTNCWPWLGLASATPTWSNWTSPTAICRFFTNCGPKNAIFAVRRFGATNNDLSVSYAIGGTASNGVDYATLPGWVTIPAGQRAALVSVVPLDDGPPDINSTVVLRLTPSTNTPPDYLVGMSASAAALILDGQWPAPAAAVLPDRCFHVTATGPNGAWFRIDCTTDLIHWTSLCTNQVVNGSIDFVDADAPNNATRFYRAVPVMQTPAF
jgi:hypothetical protein